MKRAAVLTFISSFLSAIIAHSPDPVEQHIISLYTESSPNTGIPDTTRAHWMHKAIDALHTLRSPCPFEAFGSVIVNHTASSTDNTDPGELICIGANAIREVGNPTLHGEIAAINNCTDVLGDPDGPYKLSAAEITEAWKTLSLYTTAEACPMCATAIRWAGFKEYLYATSSDTLLELGWPQLSINSRELFARSKALPGQTKLIRDIAADATDELFKWQFNEDAKCPQGCSRADSGECTAD